MSKTQFRTGGPAYDTDQRGRTRDDYTPKYKWRPTYPGERCHHTNEPLQDFITQIEGVQGGRISLDVTHFPGEWTWAGATPPGFKGSPILPHRGRELTARQACRRAEEYWDAMCTLRDQREAE